MPLKKQLPDRRTKFTLVRWKPKYIWEFRTPYALYKNNELLVVREADVVGLTLKKLGFSVKHVTAPNHWIQRHKNQVDSCLWPEELGKVELVLHKKTTRERLVYGWLKNQKK